MAKQRLIPVKVIIRQIKPPQKMWAVKDTKTKRFVGGLLNDKTFKTKRLAQAWIKKPRLVTFE
jgi:hypothetical protein